MGAAPGVIHTGLFFVLIPLEVVEKINGVKDKYIQMLTSNVQQ
jgi:hypothetical protein